MAIALSGKIDGSLNSSLLSASGALAGLEKKLGSLNAAQQKVAKYNGLKNNMAAMNVEYQTSQAEVRKLGEWMSKMGKPSKEMQSQFDRAQAKSEKLREKLFGQKKELDALGRELTKTGASTKNLGQFEDDLAIKAERAARAQAGLMEAQSARNAARDRLKFSNMKDEIMGSGAILLALRQPIKAAAELETTMAEIKKVVDFDSPEAFKAMGTDLQNLSLKIPRVLTYI
jgi:chromosome segregation ATPase